MEQCREQNDGTSISLKNSEQGAHNAPVRNFGVAKRLGDTYNLVAKMIDKGYVKVRDVDSVRELFERMTDRNVISWAAVIVGCAQIMLKIEHYSCVVGLLRRGGYLEIATILIEEMPFKADEVNCGSPLVASRIHEDLELGECLLRHFTKLIQTRKSEYRDEQFCKNNPLLMKIMAFCLAALEELEVVKWFHLAAQKMFVKVAETNTVFVTCGELMGDQIFFILVFLYWLAQLLNVVVASLLSEISAILVDRLHLSGHIVSVAAWTHSCSTTCILYVDDKLNGGGPISDDHYSNGERDIQKPQLVGYFSKFYWD
ncbi:hypothetical protein NE237_029095 [Protea cynaroides]|uniref:Pentatricopeptide repeat-containing protein n=1 Tax=Protea cynaroides TaxID=273540 RepID=A0A9Q0JVY3_9MAGN|nr:hypothetical protein NE237_029095 [Protea cynaroides]